MVANGLNTGFPISLAGNLTTAGALTTSGSNPLTLTTTGSTNVTLPTSGTLATVSQIPTGAALTTNNDTNVTLTTGGSASTSLINAASITAGWSGTLSSARGGTGVNNGSNTVTLAGNLATSGANSLTLTTTGSTNVTLPTSGTLATTTQLAGYLPLTGGILSGELDIEINAPSSNAVLELFNTSSTGSGSNARFDIITRQAGGGDPFIGWSLVGAPTISYYAGIDNTDDTFKMGVGLVVGTTPSFSVNNSTGVFSLNTPLALTSGGTNKSLTASNGGIVYTDSDSMEVLSGTATAGQVLRSGASSAPSWSTATYPATTTINQVLYSSANNTISEITAANNGVLQTSATGVPSLSTTQTYTPTIGDGTNNFTTSTASGWYYRVGARTFVDINLIWTGKGSAGAGNSIRISLPITAAAAPGSNCFAYGFVSGITSTTQLFAFANGGDSVIQPVRFSSGGSASGLLVSEVGTSGQIQLSGWVGS